MNIPVMCLFGFLSKLWIRSFKPKIESFSLFNRLYTEACVGNVCIGSEDQAEVNEIKISTQLNQLSISYSMNIKQMKQTFGNT